MDLSKASNDGLFTKSLAREGDIFPSACNKSRRARRWGVVGGGERGRGSGGGVTSLFRDGLVVDLGGVTVD